MIWSFIVESLASGAVAAVLLALAGYLCRAQIAHWLNKDIEGIKAKHQQDLEAYKVSLIAEAERARATQEIKKAMAVLIAEKKFHAIDQLHQTVDPQARNLMAYLHTAHRYALEDRLIAYNALSASHDAFASAARMAAVFLPIEHNILLSDFSSLLSSQLMIAAKRLQDDNQWTSAELIEFQRELMPLQLASDQIVARHMHEMLGMLESTSEQSSH